MSLYQHSNLMSRAKMSGHSGGGVWLAKRPRPMAKACSLARVLGRGKDDAAGNAALSAALVVRGGEILPPSFWGADKLDKNGRRG
jgi:hypothetical protein